MEHKYEQLDVWTGEPMESQPQKKKRRQPKSGVTSATPIVAEGIRVPAAETTATVHDAGAQGVPTAEGPLTDVLAEDLQDAAQQAESDQDVGRKARVSRAETHPNGSFVVPRGLLEKMKPLTVADLKVYLVLCSLADNAGRIEDRGVKDIAGAAGIQIRAVQEAFRTLQRKGLIKRAQTYGKRNSYRILGGAYWR